MTTAGRFQKERNKSSLQGTSLTDTNGLCPGVSGFEILESLPHESRTAVGLAICDNEAGQTSVEAFEHLTCH